jgi:hypothetical protein
MTVTCLTRDCHVAKMFSVRLAALAALSTQQLDR